MLEAPQPDYEQLVQRTLAGVPQKNAPVLSFQGVNQVRQFVDAGHAVDLTPFVKDDPRWREDGYYETMMALGRFGERQMAIPFAISTPIMYYNADLFRKAGLDPDKPPKTWPEVIAAAKKIQSAAPNATGLFYDYLITGNWGFQVLVYSEGGSMMTADESDVAFDQAPGLRAARLLRSFIDEGVMEGLEPRPRRAGVHCRECRLLLLLHLLAERRGGQGPLRPAHRVLSGELDRQAPAAFRRQRGRDHHQ